jgi:ElaB/YqjD/DUF883 family membrane-anchored ribosome-binding protein
MKHIAALLILCLLSPTVWAQDKEPEMVPKPIFTDCLPSLRCVDAENYARIIQMRVQYLWLHDDYTVQAPKAARAAAEMLRLKTDESAVFEEQAARLQVEYDALSREYAELLAAGDKTSVWDDLPTIAISGTVGLVVGVLATLVLVVTLK